MYLKELGWILVNWRRIRKCDGLLWARGVSWLAKKIKTSQEELRSMELASCIAFSLGWRAGRISTLYVHYWISCSLTHDRVAAYREHYTQITWNPTLGSHPEPDPSTYSHCLSKAAYRLEHSVATNSGTWLHWVLLAPRLRFGQNAQHSGERAAPYIYTLNKSMRDLQRRFGQCD